MKKPRKGQDVEPLAGGGKIGKSFLRHEAQKDILRQYRYYLLEEETGKIADRFLISVQATIEDVCRNPGIGAPQHFENPFLRGIRSWPVKGFSDIRIYYLRSEKTVRIVRILHGKRDIRAVLEEG